MSCIDAWLSSRSACPICKHDASKPLPGGREAEGAPGLGGDVEAGGAAGARGLGRRWWPAWLR